VTFEKGIAKADWPARMQRLSHGRLTALLPSGAELWLDGAHNADGGRAVASALGDLEERVPRPLVLVVGMLASKNHQAFLKNFAGLARRLIAVAIPRQAKTISADEIASAAQAIGVPAQPAEDIPAALGFIATFGLDPPPRVLVTGSLYLAGEVLALNETMPG
jgi:dihydrofolate synthase/folylpolyglutamate synthase